MNKRVIKIVKRTADPIREKTVAPPQETPTRRKVERNQQQAVNAWIEERRRNTEIETSNSHAWLREMRLQPGT